MQIRRGGENRDMLGVPLARIGGRFADEQGHLVAAGREIIGQFRPEAAGGKIGESPHVVQRLHRSARQ